MDAGLPDLDPGDPAFIADPYPVFARLREAGPVHRSAALGLYVAVSHAACDAVLRDRSLQRIWKDREPAELFPAFNLLHRTSILENEPPTHTRLRRLVAAAFGRGHVERMRPWVDGLTAGLVGELRERTADGGTADLLETLAEPLPVEVIAHLLGVPQTDRPLLRPWSNAIVKMYEYGLDDAGRAAAERASARFVAYLRELITERRAAPQENDLVSDLIAASDGADRLSRDEIVGTCVLLLMAGHEATVNVIGNGLHAMLTGRAGGQRGGRSAGRPWRAVVDDASLVPTCVEEMIRFDSSLQLFERTVTRDVEIGGTLIPAGAKIAALLGAANRDPAAFEDPDVFDPARAPNPHLGFGAGIHFCLGAPLARVELRSAVSALRSGMPGLTLVEPPARRPEFVIRGLTELRVGRV